MESDLQETIRRLRRYIDDGGPPSGDVLDPEQLARKTALPVQTVHALLRGERPDPMHIEERVTSRLMTLTSSHLAATNLGFGDLVSHVSQALRLPWPRAAKILKGGKVPTISQLRTLATLFGVPDGSSFFTRPPADALNRELLRALHHHERNAQDPDEAAIARVMRKYGVIRTDMRLHGALSAEDMERLFVELGFHRVEE